MSTRSPVALGLLLLALTLPLEAQNRIPKDLQETSSWREVGPYRGGRSAAVAGIPQDRNTYYMGVSGGGVWKTRDAGRSWQNVSDGFFGGSIGAVAVSEWDPNVVWVGGGEKTVRGNVSHGDGIWRSTDAGRTWKQLGLKSSRHVSRIRIHPRDPDVAWAAVMGDLYKSSPERGVFRTKDGGETWERVLFVNDDAGCVDLALDPTNPRILYAGFWRVRRTPYSLESGGQGSGIWKSVDGGDTWERLNDKPGFPEGPIGICGVTVSASNPDNVYAGIEAKGGGIFRSRDGGETWNRVNSERKLRQRAWYYTRLQADPQDEEVVYVLNVRFWRSEDGGRTYSSIAVPHGDNHDLWIDPADPMRMIQANDGGSNVSFDGGATWSTQSNQPTAQMYRVSLDNAYPFRLLGGQQDNSAIRLRSRNIDGSSIREDDWESSAGGESGHLAAHPRDPDIVFGGSYGGFLTMRNHRTGERRNVHVWPDNPMGAGARDLKYRFNWNFPLHFTRHDGQTLYCAANVLFKSEDLGQTWTAISPDLTRNDPSKLGSSGGPITKDNTSVEYYCTIFAFAESATNKKVLWTGSDDGLVQLTRDGGETWADVTPKGLPEWSMINSIEAHPSIEGGLYVAATTYKLGDFTPSLWKTTDFGKTWARIDRGIRRDHFTRVVRADPARPGLLFAGTERLVYVSFDDGARWEPFRLGLPEVPITDLAIRGRHLVAATQGRGYWIYDDLHLVRQLGDMDDLGFFHAFIPEAVERVSMRRANATGRAGTNPQPGLVVDYFLADDLGKDGELELKILGDGGEELRRFVHEGGAKRDPNGGEGRIDRLSKKAGFHRFTWDLTVAGAERFDGMVLWNGRLGGPRVPPGRYTLNLSYVSGDGTRKGSMTMPFRVNPDPRSSASVGDLDAQYAFRLQVRDKLTETHRALRRLRDLRGQMSDLEKRVGKDAIPDAASQAMKSLRADMKSIEETLYQTKNRSRQDPLNFPIRLNDKLAGLNGAAGTGDFPPTAAMHAVYAELAGKIDVQLGKLKEVIAAGLPEVNAALAAASLPILLDPEGKND